MYTCPTCREAAPSHAAHHCLATQCNLCHRWGHSDNVCNLWICGRCNTSGHVVDNCLVTLAALTEEATLTTMTSTPLWMTTREMVCIEPGSRVYEGGNVMISFLSHVFFLISVVQHPYFHFAPSHKETIHYLLAFLLYSSPLMFPL